MIKLNPKVAINFWWRELKKQIRVEGFIEKASEKDSDDYALIQGLLNQEYQQSFLIKAQKFPLMKI